jgi:hypothetical protein
MNVVRVRHMGMRVLQWLVAMAVAVFACKHGIVGVLVMRCPSFFAFQQVGLMPSGPGRNI